MDWEELCAKAKEIGYYLCYNYNDIQGLGNCDRRNLFSFYSNGTITFNDTVVTRDRTPTEMYQLMVTIQDHLHKNALKEVEN